MDNLKRWLAAPVFEDEDKTWAAWLFNLLTLSFLGLLGAFVLLRMMFGQSAEGWNVTSLAMIGLMGLMVGMQAVMRQGYVKTASAVVIGGSWVTLVYLAWDNRGVNDTALSALLVTILLANLLINWQSGVMVSVLSTLMVWGIAYAQSTGLIAASSSPYPFRDALDLTVVFTVSTLVMILTTIHLNNVASRARQSEKSLTSSAQELQALNISLEQQVSDRTRRLEAVAHLSGHLATILHVDELLEELVNQVKDTFGYYHVQVYLLDKSYQKLVLAAAPGEVGAKMKAAGHHILLNTPANLAARAARTGQTTLEANLPQLVDWQPNPLLPDTRSQMAVPIMLEQQAVGVLDVQENKVAGLTDSDANMLRSLVNQVAIAIQNARNFEQIEASLGEVQAAQEQYITGAWQKAKVSAGVEPYLYTQPGAAPLNETAQQGLLAKQQLILTQSVPVIVESNQESARHTLVAPINLRQKISAHCSCKPVVRPPPGVKMTWPPLRLLWTRWPKPPKTCACLMKCVSRPPRSKPSGRCLKGCRRPPTWRIW
jgi:GAF domain-containing protein